METLINKLLTQETVFGAMVIVAFVVVVVLLVEYVRKIHFPHRSKMNAIEAAKEQNLADFFVSARESQEVTSNTLPELLKGQRELMDEFMQSRRNSSE